MKQENFMKLAENNDTVRNEVGSRYFNILRTIVVMNARVWRLRPLGATQGKTGAIT